MAALTTMTDYAYFQASHPTLGIFQLKKDLAIGATSLTANFELVDETGSVPTLDFFISLTNKDNITEVMKVTNVSGTTLTIVKGMPRGGLDFTTVTANDVEHKAGQTIKVIPYSGVVQMIADGLLGNISVSLKLASNPSFDAGISIAPNTYADVATRNAAIPSPADWVFAGVDDTGMTYYNPTTFQWETLDTGTPTPDASLTVAGKVEVATSAESLAGTDTGTTGALLSVLPSDIASNVQNGNFLFSSVSGTNTYTATLTPAITAYTDGAVYNLNFTNANTGASSLNINGLGATDLKKISEGSKVALEAGDIIDDSQTQVMYSLNDDAFILLSPAYQMSTADAKTLTDGSDIPITGHIHLDIAAVAGTDVVSAEANTERSANSGTTTYTKIKEIEVNRVGTYTVSFDLAELSTSSTVYGRVYKNGVAIGTERSSGSATYQTFSEDFTFAVGDLVQIYYKRTSGIVAVRNFNLKYSIEITSATGTVNTD